MKTDKIPTTDNLNNSTPAVNSDNNSVGDNSTTTDTLFAEEAASTAQPKQQRASVRQRKLGISGTDEDCRPSFAQYQQCHMATA